jgi:hypothetical protein
MNHNKLKSFGTSRIVAPDADGTWVEFTSQDDIEAGCKWENSCRFSQTSPTPYMTWPLVEDFGYLAQGPATQAVLAGTSMLLRPAPTSMRANCSLTSRWTLLLLLLRQ